MWSNDNWKKDKPTFDSWANGDLKSLLTVAVSRSDVEAIRFLVEEMKADVNIKVRGHSNNT
jgi:hypothetical protein